MGTIPIKTNCPIRAISRVGGGNYVFISLFVLVECIFKLSRFAEFSRQEDRHSAPCIWTLSQKEHRQRRAGGQEDIK